ncbi:MAG TPA: hypothetical protein ENK14_05795 [Caldithrix sp.]|nr:hypothetical protein [Caldithrix sp.]
MNWYEFIGYLASLLIALSLMMSSIVRLRWIGLLGAVLFSIYGVFIHSVPVVLLNGFNALVHFYYLIQISRRKEYFELMTVPNKDTPFLQRFVRFYWEELSYYFPDFDLQKIKKPLIYFIFRDMNPAALFIAEPYDKTTLKILVDYVTPNYRDMKSAHYIFLKSKKLFGTKGYQRFITKAQVKKHEKYLKKMGFRRVQINGEIYFEKGI